MTSENHSHGHQGEALAHLRWRVAILQVDVLALSESLSAEVTTDDLRRD
jgi:hypothetical protein